MDQTQIIFGILATAIIAIILTYLITKSKYQKQANEFKTLQDGINQSKQKLAAVLLSKEEIELSILKFKEEFADLISLRDKEAELKISVEEAQTQFKASKSKMIELKENINIQQAELQDLMGYLDLYSRIDEFTACGHYDEPEYLFETSLRFAEEIKDIRQQQKDMIADKTAVTFPETTIISRDKAFNKKILNGQIKLMLTAFNIECDLLIGGVKPANFARILERIEKLANNLEKSLATFECGFNIDYIELKFEECKLQYQFTLKKQEEMAEQKFIREQIREEQRAIKEYEKAITEAEKEEKLYRALLDKARNELTTASEEERTIALRRIDELEQQLLEAEAKEERAKSMAQQTRKGHVYIISNIGSFGEDVYKIGLTRRLEPMDRVKELGDASVPFSFDVHAMIYAEDAPALETALHREFSYHRVNAINRRKEFFKTDLDSIKDAVDRIAGVDAEFKMTALAKDYYESQRLRTDAA